MALKNSTDRGALERLLLSRLPRKEISTLVQSYTQPYRALMDLRRVLMLSMGLRSYWSESSSLRTLNLVSTSIIAALSRQTSTSSPTPF